MSDRIYESGRDLYEARLAQGWTSVTLSSNSSTALLREAWDWLEEQVGPGVGKNDMSTRDDNGEWDNLLHVCFVFKNPNDAMLFKLTWGGL